MIKKMLVVLLLISIAVPCFADIVDTAWVRRYDGPASSSDAASAIAVDASGNVYVTGSSVGIGTVSDYATIKYYPNGDTAWLRRYNGPGNQTDRALAIAVDDSGYVYVTGASGQAESPPINEDYATIKYHPNGDTAWVRRYNGPADSTDEASAIAVDDSGCVYVTGESRGTGTIRDYATIKYFPNGDTAWVRRYDGPVAGYDCATDIVVDDSGNVYVTGYSDGSGTGDDYATIKYYPNGDTAWVRRYDGPINKDDRAYGIAIDDSGCAFVTGKIYGHDYATIKYFPNGDTAWVRTYHGPFGIANYGMYLVLDDMGNVHVTGYSISFIIYF